MVSLRLIMNSWMSIYLNFINTRVVEKVLRYVPKHFWCGNTLLFLQNKNKNNSNSCNNFWSVEVNKMVTTVYPINSADEVEKFWNNSRIYLSVCPPPSLSINLSLSLSLYIYIYIYIYTCLSFVCLSFCVCVWRAIV